MNYLLLIDLVIIRKQCRKMRRKYSLLKIDQITGLSVIFLSPTSGRGEV